MWTSMRLLTIMTSAIAFALPGCGVRQQHVLVDRTVPHQLNRDADVYILERRADGSKVEEFIHVEKGWIIAAPEVVEPR